MKKEYALSLKPAAEKAAAVFSNKERQYNAGETFTVAKIQPLSDDAAVVYYDKSSGKKAAAFFYFVKGFNDWCYFFPTDSHILGMNMFGLAKMKVEMANYPVNFEERKVEQ